MTDIDKFNLLKLQWKLRGNPDSLTQSELLLLGTLSFDAMNSKLDKLTEWLGSISRYLSKMELGDRRGRYASKMAAENAADERNKIRHLLLCGYKVDED